MVLDCHLGQGGRSRVEHGEATPLSVVATWVFQTIYAPREASAATDSIGRATRLRS
jgi:hypothetical protein